MEPVPSLREVFAALAGGSADPASALAASGHGDLPGDLVAQAIVNYADTAPVEVAEHLSPFVVAHSGVPQGVDAPAHLPDTGDGLHLLGAAPAGPEHLDVHSHIDPDAHPDVHSDVQSDLHSDGQALLDAGATGDEGDHGEHGDHSGPGDHGDLSFGAGEPGTTAAHHGPDAAASHADDHADGHATLDATGHEGWIDVTSPSFGPDLDHPADADDDWTHSHTTEGDTAAPEHLDDHHHGGDEVLGGGAGA
jgi:hypothetical protein